LGEPAIRRSAELGEAESLLGHELIRGLQIPPKGRPQPITLIRRKTLEKSPKGRFVRSRPEVRLPLFGLELLPEGIPSQIEIRNHPPGGFGGIRICSSLLSLFSSFPRFRSGYGLGSIPVSVLETTRFRFGYGLGFRSWGPTAASPVLTGFFDLGLRLYVEGV
jgi:hypothetical protein